MPHECATKASYYYALYITSASTQPSSAAQLLGIYSSLELAKTEGARYHKKAPLNWTECVSDLSPKTPDHWFAPLVSWHENCEICIDRKRLDGRAFRPIG